MKFHVIMYFNELVRSRSIRQSSEIFEIYLTVVSRELRTLFRCFTHGSWCLWLWSHYALKNSIAFILNVQAW